MRFVKMTVDNCSAWNGLMWTDSREKKKKNFDADEYQGNVDKFRKCERECGHTWRKDGQNNKETSVATRRRPQ